MDMNNKEIDLFCIIYFFLVARHAYIPTYANILDF